MARNGDPRMPMQEFGKYGYLRTPYEIVRNTAPDGSDARGPIRSSYAPSGLNEAPKPWLTRGMPQGRAGPGGAGPGAGSAEADALPRRFHDGRMPADWVEGVLERDEAGEDGAPATAPAPFTAPRVLQRTYETPQAGGCLCGAVRFAVNAGREPRLVVACHCKFCQKASGGPFLCWATIDAEDYTILQGEPAEYEQSGGVRRFCGACGTPLSFMRSDLEDELDVSLMAFDDPALWEIEMSIWMDHRAPPLGLELKPCWKEDPARLLRQGQQEL